MELDYQRIDAELLAGLEQLPDLNITRENVVSVRAALAAQPSATPVDVMEAQYKVQCDGKGVALYVYRKSNRKNQPVLLWIHGGGWVSGAPEIFIPQMKYFASRGVVSFSVQYRLYKGFSYKNDKKLSAEENAKLKEAKLKEYTSTPADPAISDIVQDCEDAMIYIRKKAGRFGIDPQEITSIGDSSGSHLAASLGTLARIEARSNAVVACSSITDLTTGFGPDYIKKTKGFEDEKMVDDPDRLKRAQAVSPLFNIVKGSSFLVLAVSVLVSQVLFPFF